MSTAPTFLVQNWPLNRIRPYPRNARKITQAAIDKVALSLREFGWRQPIVVDPDGVIVVGHVRFAGAQANGWSEAPVHVADNLTPDQIRQYRLMDNRSHDEASWDLEVLALEMADLQQLSLSLDMTGFSPQQLSMIQAPEAGNVDPDIPAEPAAVAVSRRGDLWICGENLVLCGDSTLPADVGKILGGRRPPVLMVTDPPYGVEYDPEWRNDASHAGFSSMGAPGGRAMGKVSNDDRDDWREAWQLFPGDVAYVWHSALHSSAVASSLLAANFHLRTQIIWVKSHLVISRGHYHWQHEPCWYAVRKGGTARWNGDRTQTTTWNIPKPQASETGHSTQKPVELMRRPILNHTVAGDPVYDPFLGSGSTLIAAASIGRPCYGIELEPLYVDVAIRRWQGFTGLEAHLADSGSPLVSFAEVTEERKASEVGSGGLHAQA